MIAERPQEEPASVAVATRQTVSPDSARRQEEISGGEQCDQCTAENATPIHNTSLEGDADARSNGCQKEPPAKKKFKRKFRRHKHRENTSGQTREQNAPSVQQKAPADDSDVIETLSEFDDDLPRIVINAENLASRSLPFDRLFIEDSRHFRTVAHSNSSEGSPTNTESGPLHSAMKLQQVFSRLATFCQGLQAGMALWQCLALETTPAVAALSARLYPVYKAVFYFFTLVCLVHSLDRTDLAQWKWRAHGHAPRLMAAPALIYAAVLLVHLCTPDHTDPKPRMEPQYHIRWMEIAKCVGSLLGWATVAFSADGDCTLTRLRDGDRKRAVR